MEESAPPKARIGRVRYLFRFSMLFFQYVFDHITDVVADSARLMAREKELFLGVGLFFIGLLSFETGKYCDGNSADYLSCTRPAVYYYFDTLDIVCVVLGAFLILIWYLKKSEQWSRE